MKDINEYISEGILIRIRSKEISMYMIYRWVSERVNAGYGVSANVT